MLHNTSVSPFPKSFSHCFNFVSTSGYCSPIILPLGAGSVCGLTLGPPCGLTPGPPGQLPAESARGAGSFVWEDIVYRFEHPRGAFLLLFYENEWETRNGCAHTGSERHGPHKFPAWRQSRGPGRWRIDGLDGGLGLIAWACACKGGMSRSVPLPMTPRGRWVWDSSVLHASQRQEAPDSL